MTTKQWGYLMLAVGAAAVVGGLILFFTPKADAVNLIPRRAYCHATSSEEHPYVYLFNRAWIFHLRDNGTPLAGHELDFFTFVGNTDCVRGTPTPTVTVTPTPTPEVTPTPTPVCEDDEKDCVTPTPTPEVTPTPACTGNCGNPPTFAGSSTNPPVCSDGTTTQLPANVQVARKGSDATVSFFITQGNSANIYYKVVGQNDWQFSVADVKPNGDKFVSYTIGGLDPALGYTFGVQQVEGCGGGQIATAVVVDGPETHVFGFSYWMW